MLIDVLTVIARAGIIYLFIILALRLFGKKELTQLSVLDLVFILLISNSVQNAMVGNNTTLLGGVVAATTLFVLNFALGAVFLKSKKIEEFFEGDPLMLIYKGKIVEEHLKKAQISQEELEAAVREHGVKSISEVNLAILETDGNISVLSDDYKRISIKKRKGHRFIQRDG